MKIKIENKAGFLIIIPLNSGKTIHLAPGERSSVESLELNGNARITKLQKSNLISTVIEEEKPVAIGAVGIQKKRSIKAVSK